ncbi:hypothetical protein [Roseomonas chloroacetimidivorans]|uniref:hypothetical protein n=1 Tax=Roseomonas chloroacetimidivorans TaxID=1766656 RepID=UPI003C722049
MKRYPHGVGDSPFPTKLSPDGELMKVVKTGDCMDPWQRSLVGKSAQMRMPLHDPVDLRRQAAILRELANRLEAISRNTKETPFNVMSLAKTEVAAAQARMMSKPRTRPL